MFEQYHYLIILVFLFYAYCALLFGPVFFLYKYRFDLENFKPIYTKRIYVLQICRSFKSAKNIGTQIANRIKRVRCANRKLLHLRKDR